MLGRGAAFGAGRHRRRGRGRPSLGPRPRTGAAGGVRCPDARRRHADGGPADPRQTGWRGPDRPPSLRVDDPIITFNPTFACQCPRALKVAGHRDRGRPADRLPRRRRRLPGGPGPAARPGLAHGVRRRHLPGGHHHHQRGRSRRPGRLGHPARLGPGPPPHPRLRCRVASSAHAWRSAPTPDGSPGPSPSSSSPSRATPPSAHSPASSDLRHPPQPDHFPTSTKENPHDLDGPQPPPAARHRPDHRLPPRPPGPARRAGDPPRQRRHRGVAAGHRRARRLRPAGRVRALRRGLAGQRLGVGDCPRAGAAALRWQRQHGDPGRRALHRRPGHRRATAEQVLARATALLRQDPRIADIVQPQPGATLSQDGRTAVLLAGANADPNEMVRAADDLKGPLQGLSTRPSRSTRPAPRCCGRTSTRPTSRR